MIRFEHVTRLYEPGGRPALDDVSVEFNRGDFVFLIGASGSGKSTLLRMILREGLPQKGKITVAGQNLGLMLERRVPGFRRSIGMVFQDFRLLPDKTVFDNVAFAMRVIGAKRSQIRKRVEKVLKRVNLDHLAHRYPHEISGGEQQRAAIARAIVNEPAILLADEPTGNLDPRASDEVMKILRWVNSTGTTVIMATHDRSIVDKMSKRVVQLHQGKLIRDEAKGSYDPKPGSEAWKVLVTEEQISGGFRASDPMPLRHDREDQSAQDEQEATGEDVGRRQGAEAGAVAENESPAASEPKQSNARRETEQTGTEQAGNSDPVAEESEAADTDRLGQPANEDAPAAHGADEQRETRSEKTGRRKKPARRKRKDTKKADSSEKSVSARHGKPKPPAAPAQADQIRQADQTDAESADIDTGESVVSSSSAESLATEAAETGRVTEAESTHEADEPGRGRREPLAGKPAIPSAVPAEGTRRARRGNGESLTTDSSLAKTSSAASDIEEPDLEIDPSPKRAVHQDPEGEEVVSRDEPQETVPARDASLGPEEQDPTPEFPLAAPESLRVTWPDHLHKDQAATTLPEPRGDFNGTELPDLDKDGYAEDEPVQESERRPGGGPAPDEDDTAEFPAATEDSAAEKPAAKAVSPSSPEKPGPAGSPDVGTADETPDALEEAAAAQPTTADNPHAVTPRPRLSWLAHADDEPVDKAMTGRSAQGVRGQPDGEVPRATAEEKGAVPVSGGHAQNEPDIEDLRLAEQSTDDEPPSEPQASPSEPVPGLPADHGETSPGLEEARQAEPQAEPHESQAPETGVEHTEARDDEALHGETQGTGAHVHETSVTESLDPEASRKKSELPPEQRPVPEEISDEDFDVEPEADDLEDIDPPLENSLRETNPAPVPRPKSSASQSTWTDTKRTAEQLGVSGSQRSFWRRMKRRK